MPKHTFKSIEFKVLACEPQDFGIVTPNTVIFTEGKPIQREGEEDSENISYNDIGGCTKQIAQIRSILELPLKRPKLFETLGVRAPTAVLLSGPQGIQI